MLAVLALISTADASGGPWVPGDGKAQLYLGVESERFTTLKANGTEEGVSRVPIAGGVSTLRAVGELSYGIASRAEFSLTVPLQRAFVHRPDDALCGAFGLGACDTTSSVGVIEARLKGLVSDQVSGAPVSFAVGGVVRYGGLTAGTRQRLTNAGEGTTDVGGRLSLGRSGPLGGGYYVLQVDAQGLYRIPLSSDFPVGEGERSVPGAEVAAATDLLIAPSARFSFGPTVSFAARPGGIDVGEMLSTAAAGDVDRFLGLRYAEVRVGGKLIVQDESYNAISLSVLRMGWGMNTPTDTLGIGVGVTIADLMGARS